MTSKRDTDYNKLIDHIKDYSEEIILRKMLEKEIYEHCGIIDPRSQRNTIKKLVLDGHIKLAGEKPIRYTIQKG